VQASITAGCTAAPTYALPATKQSPLVLSSCSILGLARNEDVTQGQAG
jgi:hypothetical protein